MKLFHKGCQGAPRLGRYHLTASVQEQKKGKRDQKEKRDKRKLQHRDGGRIFWRSLSKYARDTRGGHSAQGFVSSPQSPAVSESLGALPVEMLENVTLITCPGTPLLQRKAATEEPWKAAAKGKPNLLPKSGRQLWGEGPDPKSNEFLLAYGCTWLFLYPQGSVFRSIQCPVQHSLGPLVT